MHADKMKSNSKNALEKNVFQIILITLIYIHKINGNILIKIIFFIKI